MSNLGESWKYELTENGSFDYRAVSLAPPTGHEIVAKVHLTGVCGSDLAVFRGKHPYKRPPIVLGHEMCGTVTAVGHQVTSVSVGDLVTTAAFCSCGACEQCHVGRINLCEQRSNLSHLGWSGTFARHVVLKEPMVVRLPPDLPRLQAVLVEPLSIAWHAWQRTPLSGCRVAVVGLGGIGAAALLLAREAGAERITATDLRSDNGRFASALGADRYICASDPNERARYSGVEADVTLVSSGHPSCLEDAFELTRAGGTVIVVSYSGQPVQIPLDNYVARELTLHTSHLATRRDMDEVVNLLKRGLDATAIIAELHSIHDVERVFSRLVRGPSRPAGRVILDTAEEYNFD